MKLGFIGTGKIASAVVKGICTSTLKDVDVNLSPRNEENSKKLAKAFANVKRLEKNQLVLDKSDIIFISVLPDHAREILNNLKFRDTHTVISFVPLLRFSELADAVKPARRISRAIPLPAVVNHNCPVPVFNADETVIKLFKYLGQPFVVDNENQLHTIWTLTGFIAPFLNMLQNLSDWAVSKGVKEEIANKYIVDMFHSISFSAQQIKHIDFDELVKDAATPNGLNEQALREIYEKGAHETYKIIADNLLKRFMIDL